MRKKELEERVRALSDRVELDRGYALDQMVFDKQSILKLVEIARMFMDYLGVEVKRDEHDPERTYLAKKKGKK